MPQCLIQNCPNEAIYFLGVRLRRPADTQRAHGTAIWAPDCDAYLCEDHASQGYSINIHLTPAATRDITTNVSANGIVVTRTTPIAHLP
jgi:hypothetical protein